LGDRIQSLGDAITSGLSCCDVREIIIDGLDEFLLLALGDIPITMTTFTQDDQDDTSLRSHRDREKDGVKC